MTDARPLSMPKLIRLLGHCEHTLWAWVDFSLRYNHQGAHHQLANPLRSPTGGVVTTPDGDYIAILANGESWLFSIVKPQA